MAYFRAAISSLIEFFYPSGCLACKRSLENQKQILCERCRKEIVKLPENGCPDCGSPVERDKKCITCNRKGPQLDLIRSAVWFAGPIPDLVHRFKYQGLHSLALFFARQMVSCSAISDVVEPSEVLVPVPLHFWRKMKRGYNQSEKLGQELAKLCDKNIAVDCLVRSRRTRSQTRLSIEQRRLNVAGAFQVRRPDKIEGRTVLLIDDVMTTGATLSACALTLKMAGAKRVFAYTFARA